jgi:hypothetical protein
MGDEISRKDPRLLKNLATLNWETGEIIPATDLIDWAIWLQRTDNHVGYDEVSGFVVSFPSTRQCNGMTYEEFAQAHPGQRSEFVKFREEAEEYARSLTDPRSFNWVSIQWVWF